MAIRLTTATVLLTVLLATGGCGGGRQDDLVGRWSNPAGRSLPDGSEADDSVVVVNTFLASDHCDGRKNTVYLELAWPVGQSVDLKDPSVGRDRFRYYVRGHSVEQPVSPEPYADDVELPASATPTGFTRAGNSLSVDAAGPAYVTRPDGRTERWPQISLGCA